MSIMNNRQFVARAIDIATKYKTLYVFGGIGAPLTPSTKEYYLTTHYKASENSKFPSGKYIKEASSDTFSFDCIGLLKSILWGWNGDTKSQYGGAKYPSKDVLRANPNYPPEMGADDLMSHCSDVSYTFNSAEMLPGEALWMSGHAGIYIGNGLSIECTGNYDYGHKVIVSACNSIISGYKTRNWKSHGKLKYLDYSYNKLPQSYYTSVSKYANRNLYTSTGSISDRGDIAIGSEGLYDSSVLNVEFSPSNVELLYTGTAVFKQAPITSSDKFNEVAQFVANTNDVPYMYLPSGISSLSDEDICGKVGMIVNTSEGIYRYFIVAGIISDGEDIESTDMLISNRLMYELKYSDTESTLWLSDNDDDYTILLCTDSLKWDRDISISEQITLIGQQKFGYYSIVDSISDASVFNQEDIDTTKLYPYIVSIDRNVSDINFAKLIDFGVVGIIVESGYLYDFRHLQLDNYTNPMLSKQIKYIREANLPFGFYTITRARDVEESNLELKNLVPLLQTYSPMLGVWVKLDFMPNQIKSVNDSIIDNYRYVLSSDRVGFRNALGIYTTEQKLKMISWERHCRDWYLWLERQIDDLDNLQKLLTPENFVVE